MNILSDMGRRTHRLLSVREMAVFSMLAALMFASKIVMEALPNIHLLGAFTVAFTLVYRVKALIPIYLFVMLNGLYAGFSAWWVPYLYIWGVLWGIAMLLPRKMSRKAKKVAYPAICCLHGLLFGTLYAPAQALMFGFDFRQTLLWILSGLPWDLVHGIGNLFAGMLILPLSELLLMLEKKNRIG